VFLSSGEIGLANKLCEDGRGRRSMAGQAVRLLVVPADAGAGRGLLEDLHGAASPGALADTLRNAAGACQGTAGRAFIEHVARDVESAREAVRLVRDRSHQALLVTLYSAGNRVSEVLALRTGDDAHSRDGPLRLDGKGSRDRVVPLWKSTARLLHVRLGDRAA
jgi:integrase